MPTRKVSVSAVAGSVVTLGLFLLYIFEPTIADRVNVAVASGVTVIFSTILAYLIPEKDQAP